MSTLKPTLEELEAIKKAINSGVLKTTIDGRKVVYRNLQDMLKIRDRMEKDLGVFNKQSDTLDDITEGTKNKHFTAAEKKKLADIDADHRAAGSLDKRFRHASHTAAVIKDDHVRSEPKIRNGLIGEVGGFFLPSLLGG